MAGALEDILHGVVEGLREPYVRITVGAWAGWELSAQQTGDWTTPEAVSAAILMQGFFSAQMLAAHAITYLEVGQRIRTRGWTEWLFLSPRRRYHAEQWARRHGVHHEYLDALNRHG